MRVHLGTVECCRTLLDVDLSQCKQATISYAHRAGSELGINEGNRSNTQSNKGEAGENTDTGATKQGRAPRKNEQRDGGIETR